ncbi:hypothetical protein D3C81_1793970 [compost metagenome]
MTAGVVADAGLDKVMVCSSGWNVTVCPKASARNRKGTIVVSCIMAAGCSIVTCRLLTSATFSPMLSSMVLPEPVRVTVCVSPFQAVEAPRASPINRSGTIVTSFTSTGALCSR